MERSVKQALTSGLERWLPPVLLPYARAIAKPHQTSDPRQIELQRAFKSLNKGTSGNEITLRENLCLALHPDSRVPFEYFCWRSPEMADEMDEFLTLTRGAERLLDVGALHGVFSLVFAQQNPNRRVVAVDPSPLAFAKLLYNVHANKLTGQVDAVECALSDEPGIISMYYEWEHAVAAPLDPQQKVSATCHKITGDSLCEQLGFLPDVIKIDVEGHEVKAIRGLAAIIHRAKPRLFIELHPQRIEREHDNLEEVLCWLEKEGYASDCSSSAIPIQELCKSKSDTRVVLGVGSR
jgi:FkbM family methyltransferase